MKLYGRWKKMRKEKKLNPEKYIVEDMRKRRNIDPLHPPENMTKEEKERLERMWADVPEGTNEVHSFPVKRKKHKFEPNSM